MSEIIIAFAGGQESVDADARALRTFLNQDEELRGHVTNRLVPPGPGEQGGIADAVQIAAGLGSLIIEPLAIWLRARLRSGQVSIELKRPDGTELKISTDSVADSATLLDQVRDFLADE